MNSFLQKAETLKPQLKTTEISAVGDFGLVNLNDRKVFDFGNHFVGFVKLNFSIISGQADAPTYFAVTFAETKRDLEYVDPVTAQGTLSGGWIQQEFVRADDCSMEVVFQRRYACRYVMVCCIGHSTHYEISIDSVKMLESTACQQELQPFGRTSEERKIDEISLRTLRSCMQDVFEDGPKRDRRLWLGDLRLQALANYETYKNYDLVKRCLYLFAGTADEKGRIPGCVFTGKQTNAGAIMFDYPLLFIPTLYEYMKATSDMETVNELYELASKQIDIARETVDENGLICAEKVKDWCFIDWNSKLEKIPCAQAIYVYALKYLVLLGEELGKEVESLRLEIERVSLASIKRYYAEEKGLFVGKNGQISYALNVWFCLAGVFDQAKNRTILNNLEKQKDAIKLVTPYMYHYYTQALIDCGEKQKAYETLLFYWGGMAKSETNTFFEVYNPENPLECPYGNVALLSYCHAWSCTPSYFLRTYFRE